jgi:heterodisulfide reductase subunit C
MENDLMLPENDTLAVDFERWRQQAEALADHWSNFCRTCNACVPDCPAAKHGTDFDPRQIVLKARYGLGDRLVKQWTLWQCFRCHRCMARCPQEIKPEEVIASLRAMSLDQETRERVS